MKRQATKTHATPPAAEYVPMLRRARENAAQTMPGAHVSGLRLIGGVWHAVTTAGTIPVRDIAQPVRNLPATGDRACS